jgi:DNA-directed DNA polymerase III PolC
MREAIARIRQRYDANRLAQVDHDFLSFEEDLSMDEDLELVEQALGTGVKFDSNPHNSIILYLVGLTDHFDPDRARADTRGGSPPDIDIDFEALGRDKAVDWVVQEWGREHVANIMTQGTFKPKSLTRRYFKITDGDEAVMREILRKIPPPHFGKEPKLKEIVEGNKDKGYEPHPELATNPKYAGWYEFTKKLEGMTANFGIHAAGIVISDFPIPDSIPCWKNSKSEFITQYDMHEVEELGSIKFDFLVINNLDILKECVRLIKERHNIEYDIYNVADGDEKAYTLMHQGLLTGVFQMETSGSAKKLIQRIQPVNLDELSDINALNRPGPMEAGLDEAYIVNKANGYAPSDMPPALAEILRDTYWTLVYQEQIMRMVSDLAGFTLQEADDVRRAMGKKKMEVLEKYREPFITGCVAHHIDKRYAEILWDDTLIGFANYCFNKSHSLAYSVITYLCAFFKANYPTEFFTALMTIRSQVMQPKLWAQKAPEFVSEAKQMGVKIHAPYIQKSKLGFSIEDDEIYFGFNAIKQVGVTASKSIIKARQRGPFKDIWDFLARVNRQKVTTRTFESLVRAGAFDRMGYVRAELLENTKEIYAYFNDNIEYEQRLQDQVVRAAENEQKDARKAEIDQQVKEAKALLKQLVKQSMPVPASIERLATMDKRLREMRQQIRDTGLPAEEVLSDEDLEEYNETLWLRKKPELKLKDKPVQPELTRTRSVKISVAELMEQADMIGCYLHQHPAPVIYPDTTRVAMAEEGAYLQMAGQITNWKQIKTRKGDDMAFAEMGDGTGLVELVIFPHVYRSLKARGRLPEVGDIVYIRCEVETADDSGCKVLVNDTEIYQPTK